MTRIDKLIMHMQARPPEVDFGDVDRLLRWFGWTIANEKGSHVTYRKPDELPLVIPKSGGRKVKREYVDRVCRRLGLDDLS